ncbi:Succinate dehydrogenase cytochrome b-556 subunit [Candidatus Rhodobacter oscarellae]|uniref:Succinate dehydrogenase cytochrome b556 subunit n=2 Tax=Candidatus Rhodobacter oscarellae TaxID=1675527 RepID=A0A0J9GXP1_9RHOB|nr:Succinate dehydrogenase cytochrome b-556 subunit [Candidatus Rhodobacter lobularis]
MVRLTGIALLGAAVFVVWWLLAAATSQAAFGGIDAFLRSWFGDLIMFGATWAVFYHVLGRLRHVLWDFGYCLEVETSERLAIGMFGLATLLALICAVAL